jgi:hypothetical protein
MAWAVVYRVAWLQSMAKTPFILQNYSNGVAQNPRTGSTSRLNLQLSVRSLGHGDGFQQNS